MNNKIIGNYDSGIIEWFARNSVAANLLMVFIIFVGLASAWTIKKKIFPDFDINTVQVEVIYPGASPDDVELGLVFKLEEAVRYITGVKKIVSLAQEGLGKVLIEVQTGFDVNEVYDEVKSAVESLSNLPEKAEKPVISMLDPKKRVAIITVYGQLDRLSLQRLAQGLHQELLDLPEVLKAEVMGERNLEISIDVSEEALREYDLTFDFLAQKLRSSSIDIAGGSIKTADGNISVKARGQAYSSIDYANLVIRSNIDGILLHLGDVAVIKDGFEEDEAIVSFNGLPAVSVQVLSEGDQSDLETVRAVKSYIEKRKASLPAGASVDIWADISYYLEGRMNMMLKNMLYGALLVFMILSLFLRIRVAFWVVVGIPVCFLGAIWLMPHGPLPVSINLISLFAFILVLGIVVDDAIIIGESVHTQTLRHGHSLENVIIGVKRVVVPATFGVLTTMAVFIPVLFVEGQGAPFFESIGVVVILCLLFSLIESKLILPAHLANARNVSEISSNNIKKRSFLLHRIEIIQNYFEKQLQVFILKYYQPLLGKAIDRRYVTLSLFIGILMVTIGLAISPVMRFVFFPKLPSDFIQVELKMNAGTSLAARNSVIESIEAAINSIDRDYTKINPNSFLLSSLFVRSTGDSGGLIIAELTKSENRSIDAFEVVKRWRKSVGNIPGVQNINFNASTNAGGSKPIYFRLSGNDYSQVREAALEMTRKLESYDGVFDVENSTEVAVHEVVVDVSAEGKALGLPLAELGNQVRQGLYGEEVQRIQRGREEVRVMLRYPKEERNDLTDLEHVRIRTKQGGEVPFHDVALIEMGQGSSYIRRTNGKRSVAVMAEVDTRRIEPDAIINDIEKSFLPALYEKFPGVSSGLDGASLEQKSLFRQLGIAGIMALFLVYVLIAVPLNSYFQPLIIMSVIPFGFIGAVIGHILLNISFSLLSVYGLIALAGVLVNDSLILVSFINQGRGTGLSVYESLLGAGRERFRAIVLTSLTTFLGLAPITLEPSLQAQIVIPMAVSLGFGILFATVITLFFIPALYGIGMDTKKVYCCMLRSFNNFGA